jgi:serine phosphatase RsbU (regulator of sigma subunit)/anti-sigma regulatory factor (Ser/Thr protein kinase)
VSTDELSGAAGSVTGPERSTGTTAGDTEDAAVTTTARRGRFGSVRRLRRRAASVPTAPPPVAATPAVDEPVHLAPGDPALAYFQSADGPVDLDDCKLESPGIEALRAAGVQLVVPLVTQGELIGLLQLGPRLSEQAYSADDRQLLQSLAAQAAPALRVAQLVEEQAVEVRRRERYEQELKVAQLIQQNFLPHELPQLEGWGIDAFYRPAREVGGDFYDVIDLDDGRLGIVVGDVTDKGVPAALVMASTRSVLRASAQRLIDPSAVLERVNDQIVHDMPPGMFVTCLYGVLDPASGVFRFANAGHNLPCVQTASGVVEPKATGMPLGLMPAMTYPAVEVEVPPGHSLLLYSDALPEAHAPDGEMFGFPRVVAEVAAGPGGAELIDHLLDRLHAFTGAGWEQEDDVTLLVVRRSGRAGVEVAGPAAEVGTEVLAFDLASVPGTERAAADRVDAATADVPLTSAQRQALGTAVSEAVMNAIEHGNDEVEDRSVEVRVTVSDAALTVSVSDEGDTDLLLPTEAPDLDAKLRGEQSPRGWGLFLMRSLVDDVQVRTVDGKHTVQLTVWLGGE